MTFSLFWYDLKCCRSPWINFVVHSMTELLFRSMLLSFYSYLGIPLHVQSVRIWEFGVHQPQETQVCRSWDKVSLLYSKSDLIYCRTNHRGIYFIIFSNHFTRNHYFKWNELRIKNWINLVINLYYSIIVRIYVLRQSDNNCWYGPEKKWKSP